MAGKKKEKKFCISCGAEMKLDDKFCTACGGEENHPKIEKKEVIKKDNNKFPTWAIVLIVILVIVFIGGMGDSDSDAVNSSNEKYQKNESVKVAVIDLSEKTKADIDTWCEDNKINCIIKDDYSDTVAKDLFVSQSVGAGKSIYEGDKVTIIFSLGKKPSFEYINALKTAESYSENLYMSKKGIYDQLVSEYGEQFPKDAAQYAIDNLKADYKFNALKTAENYSENLYMSKKGIYDQLVSEYGEQFTKEEAQYAIDNLKVDYKFNALKTAKSYRDNLNMSKKAIYDQLISKYGEQFTKEEAQYAIDNLED